MSAPMFVQGFVIALLVAWSAFYAARRLLPATSRSLQARALAWFDRPWAPHALRALARRLTPHSLVTGAACGDGCSTCGACASSPTPARRDTDVHPLVFRPRGKS